jgi:hypothetical protein
MDLAMRPMTWNVHLCLDGGVVAKQRRWMSSTHVGGRKVVAGDEAGPARHTSLHDVMFQDSHSLPARWCLLRVALPLLQALLDWVSGHSRGGQPDQLLPARQPGRPLLWQLVQPAAALLPGRRPGGPLPAGPRPRLCSDLPGAGAPVGAAGLHHGAAGAGDQPHAGRPAQRHLQQCAGADPLPLCAQGRRVPRGAAHPAGLHPRYTTQHRRRPLCAPTADWLLTRWNSAWHSPPAQGLAPEGRLRLPMAVRQCICYHLLPEPCGTSPCGQNVVPANLPRLC